MLEVWFTNIKRVGIPNYLVVALDDHIVEFCKSNNVPVYKRDPDKGIDSVARTGGNHAVSGLKFRILREFLQLGYSVLLSDIDIVYLQNPFDHLYRDSDVESMTDGHNNMTAYGYNDVFDEPAMGWARYAHTMRIWVYNSGFFYIRPTIPSIELLDRVADRLSQQRNSGPSSVQRGALFPFTSWISSLANQFEEESRNDVYFHSPLLHEQSLGSEELPNFVKPDEKNKGNDLKLDSNRSEVPTISDQFQFSICKWASKRVPLALPLGGGNSPKWKEKFKFERCSSASGWMASEGMEKELPTVTPQDIDCPSFNISVSSDAELSKIELDKKENGYLFNISTHSGVEQGQTLKRQFFLNVDLKSQALIMKMVPNEYEGDERIKGMQVLNLVREFEMQKMKESETIKEYADKLLSIVNKVRLLGSEFFDSRIVQKILVTIPERFEATISSLENAKDLSRISLVELLNALQAQEQRRIMRAKGSMEGALQAKLQIKKNKKKNSSTPEATANTSNSSGGNNKEFPPCRHCGKKGHPPFKC
ncbi:hypothetical protein GH714_005913 [Hevea brasiliensis]|uniref:Nucleotide-diphospho-sugar transferase domain-containing protein n=1 Tax=Hevea brasiliensis TaxID=3981 RepID=A0A6A6LFW9_HEVBR|nr:hypothetical protein GH714_005913 [Hevea brasiliensis]